jgi:hypothetical protein
MHGLVCQTPEDPRWSIDHGCWRSRQHEQRFLEARGLITLLLTCRRVWVRLQYHNPWRLSDEFDLPDTPKPSGYSIQTTFSTFRLHIYACYIFLISLYLADLTLFHKSISSGTFPTGLQTS